MTNGRTWKLEAVLRVAFPCLSEAGSQRDLWEAAGLHPGMRKWVEHRAARGLCGGFLAPGQGRAGQGVRYANSETLEGGVAGQPALLSTGRHTWWVWTPAG